MKENVFPCYSLVIQLWFKLNFAECKIREENKDFGLAMFIHWFLFDLYKLEIVYNIQISILKIVLLHLTYTKDSTLTSSQINLSQDFEITSKLLIQYRASLKQNYGIFATDVIIF